jgi:crotonobetainyl-CoA:carnitine CoA-transferase CaiB-like acyl-CoA transferase
VNHLLSDIVVVELSGDVAGSYAGKLLADLGATVLIVEHPDGYLHDGSAGAEGTFRDGAWVHFNTNKESTFLDPAATGAVSRLWRYLDQADVVVQSGSASLDLWGITWEEFHARLPTASVVNIGCFGLTGPYSGYKWSDLIAQAVSGTLLLQDDPDQDPIKLPSHSAMCLVGNFAALAALAAVTVSRNGSEGMLVDCAAMEALATVPSKASTLLSHQYHDGRPRAPAETSDAQTLMPRGIYPCSDGHVAMLTTVQQLPLMLEVLGNAQLKATFETPDAFERGETKEVLDGALYPWLLARTRSEATRAAQAVGWALTGVNTPQELLQADHLHQRNFWTHSDDPVHGSVDLPGPMTRFAEGGWALRRLAPATHQPDQSNDGASSREASIDTKLAATATRSSADPVPPLKGIRVLDMTTVWAGPYATMLLADLGAEVIRVENPWIMPPATKGYQARPKISNLGFLASGYGPMATHRPDRPYNRLSMNNSICRNKFACTIDTRCAEGRELVMRLAEKSDVFIENFKANGLSRMGIQVSELQSRNPRLIVIRLPPFGSTGDWSGYAGFGAQIDGMSGLTALLGHPDTDAVTSPSTTYMDAATGPAAAFAAFAAIHYRNVTGRGQVVELAQMENVLQHLGDVFVDCQLGRQPARMGNRDRGRAPQGVYRCSGERQWIAISVSDDDEWRSLAEAMEQPELASDTRFADMSARQGNHDALDNLISKWTSSHEVLNVFHLLQAAGVTAGPLLNDEMFSNDPHVYAREWLRPLTSLDVGTHLHPGWPYRGVPQEWWRGSPALGEDNLYVYKDLLSVTDEEYERYATERILAEDYLDSSGNPL